MQTNTFTKKSSGCGCAGGSSGGSGKSGSCGCGGGGKSCGCGGKGCSSCEATPEAYSRPQFFSGQLLTEDDLQSMVDYTVAKNRLHNRMLFGEGVACGLGVTLDPCEPERRLVVRPGYAIDCCGNDIVVPCEASLDVVQLVRDLRTRTLGKDCGDPCPPPDESGAKDLETKDSEVREAAAREAAARDAAAGRLGGDISVYERRPSRRNSYCLYLVYCEQPADPVAPYDGADSCGGGECRHTRVREGYRFELRCGTASGCEPRQRVDPGQGYYQGVTGRATSIYDLLGKSTASNSLEDRARVILAMQDAMTGTGAYETAQARLIEQARKQELTQSGQARFNSIIALLLVGWLRKVDCDSLLTDCPPCDEDGVLIACFDFEDCRISNLCAQRRLQILSPGYFAQLGLAQVWRCMRIAACCRADKYTSTTGSVIDQIRGGIMEPRMLRMERAAMAMSAAGLPEDAAAAAAPAENAAPAEISLEELQDFLKERMARIDNPDVPEYRATLLPDLVRAFDASVTRAPPDAAAEHDELRKQVAALTGELDKVKRALEGIVKTRGKKGGNS